MKSELIDRINQLARKAKSEELTPEEKEEQTALRNQYRMEFRSNLTNQLEHTYIMDEKGNKRKLGKS